MYGYFDKEGTQPFQFYKVPKMLFQDRSYEYLSTDAKILYALLLDRNSLSLKNGWIDTEGRVYQYFTVGQAQELLHFGHEKICKLFRELSSYGLIDRRRQGMCRPNIIYLRKFF